MAMAVISKVQHHSLTIWMGVLVSVCCLFLGQSACSDNKGNDPPAATVVPSESTSVPEVAPETQSAVPLPSLAPSSGGACASLLTAKCTECHSTARICEKLGKKSSSRWKRSINRMIDRGAKVNIEEAATLLDCLDSGVNELQSVCQ